MKLNKRHYEHINEDKPRRCEVEGKNQILVEIDWFINSLQEIRYAIVNDDLDRIIQYYDDCAAIYITDLLDDILENVLIDTPKKDLDKSISNWIKEVLGW